jgi:AmmeMemoRadiSam system protein A
VATEVLGIIAPHPPIMVPEVGGPRARVTADSTEAMHDAARALDAYDPETIVLMSPHAPLVRDSFVIDTSPRVTGDLGQFGARDVQISAPGDPELAAAIVEEAERDGIPVVPRSGSPLLDAGLLDHGALVPLSFLDRAGRYPLVEVSLSFLPLALHRALGRAIARAARRKGRRVAFVASGDCSHRLTRDAPAGYDRHGAGFDAQLVEILSANDYPALERIDPGLIEHAGECGLRSFITLGGFLEGTGARTQVLAYEGPWGVGYLTAVAASPDLLQRAGITVVRQHDQSDIRSAGPSSGQSADSIGTAASPTASGDKPASSDPALSSESAPVALARRTIETYVRDGRVFEPPPAAGLLAERHGAFVSLHRQGDLRGCIGTIMPTQSTLAQEIVRNAIQAATCDPRFNALRPDELADLEISVDVLGEPEPATPEDLDPREYGVIVSADRRQGLLLPDLDGVDTVEEQVSIAKRKAGIAPGEGVSLQRFRVERYH